MSEEGVHHCSFCGARQNADTPLIAGLEGHICESCASCGSLAHQVVNSWGRKRWLVGPLQKPPRPLGRFHWVALWIWINTVVDLNAVGPHHGAMRPWARNACPPYSTARKGEPCLRSAGILAIV